MPCVEKQKIELEFDDLVRTRCLNIMKEKKITMSLLAKYMRKSYVSVWFALGNSTKYKRTCISMYLIKSLSVLSGVKVEEIVSEL